MSGVDRLERIRWSILAGLVVAGAVALGLVLKPADERADVADQPGGGAPASGAPAAAPAPQPPPPLARPQPNVAPRPTAPPVVGPHADDPHEPGMLPHPHDEAHARIDAENRLIQRLNDAMSFRNVADMRQMLVAYRQLDPADVDANQAGYAAIADCIEHPGEASLAAARQFYDTQRHSPLRRYMRRICFEDSN